MNYPYMQFPLTDDIDDFIDHIETRFTAGKISIIEYHILLGKALAYAEAQFSSGELTKKDAYELIHRIEGMIL